MNKKHIQNLKELKRLTCLNCGMKKAGVSCCVVDSRFCDYIVSLNFAIEILEQIHKETNGKGK